MVVEADESPVASRVFAAASPRFPGMSPNALVWEAVAVVTAVAVSKYNLKAKSLVMVSGFMFINPHTSNILNAKFPVKHTHTHTPKNKTKYLF